jgi:hypothetical protein
LIYSELGREPEARAEFEHLARKDFSDLPRDALSCACIAYLARVCAFLGDAKRAATLYRLMLPYAGRAVVAGGAVVNHGATDCYLGLLAATMCRGVEAEKHFEVAMALNARMGARPWLAHTQYEYATMLLVRGQEGDREKAGVLLNEVLAAACAP